MQIVGITGGIGSGKSTIAQALRQRGFSVYDCDEEAKRIIVEDEAVRKAIVGLLGEKAYVDGKYNTAYVAQRVFEDAGLREQLNAIVQTFTFITFTRLFFRSSSNLDPETANEVAWATAKNMVNQIGGAWSNAIIPDFLWEYRWVVAMFVAGMVIHWLPTNWKRRYRLAFSAMPLWLMVIAVCVAIVVIYQFVTADMQPFIYFQF